MSPPRLLFLAGIGNSEPDHWQSIWARGVAGAVWVEQEDWDHPVRDAWVGALEREARRTPGRKVLVAHSLACLVVAEASALAEAGVAGAFLVSVPDVGGPSFPRAASGFRPALSAPLSIPSMLVASTDDPYGTFDHAQRVARHWGSELVSVGAKGHINLGSGLGDWLEGRALLGRFLSSLP